jgi:hypothetical protein
MFQLNKKNIVLLVENQFFILQSTNKEQASTKEILI